MARSSSARAIDGKKYENVVAKELGWIAARVSPKFKYDGKGRSNIRKMAHCKPEEFIPNEKSIFDKYDVVNPIPTPNFNRFEVKEDGTEKLKYGILYSEPLPCVKNCSQMVAVFDSFGGSEESIKKVKEYNKGYNDGKKKKDSNITEYYKKQIIQLAKDNPDVIDRYNKRLLEVSSNFGDEYIKKMISTNDGLYTSHGIYTHDQLEYGWRTVKNKFCGTIRREIFVKLKNNKEDNI